MRKLWTFSLAALFVFAITSCDDQGKKCQDSKKCPEKREKCQERERRW